VIDHVQPAIARITSPQLGTAFAIDDRTALTAFHCVANPSASSSRPMVDRSKQVHAADTVELRFKPTSEPVPDAVTTAKVTDGDSARDWAMLRLDQPLKVQWRPFPLRRDELKPGDPLLLRGFPVPVQQELGGPWMSLVTVTGTTIRKGVPVISLRDDAVGDGLDPRGMSGGPVTLRSNYEEAVGVFIARAMDSTGQSQIGGALFACPARAFAEATGIAPATEATATSAAAPANASEEEPGPEDEALLAAAADEGDLVAAARLGFLRRARGDFLGAEPLLRQAARGGNAPAAWALGMAIDPDGDRITFDPAGAAEALEWFRRAATGGDVYGMATMGIRLRQHGRNDAALPWLEEAVARGGDAMAAHTLGRIHHDRGDLLRAERYERMAAERGDVRAAYDLARILLDKGKRDEAITWLRLATRDPEAVELLRSLGNEPWAAPS
jgi:tetratricopeptide (TPR) repeat protein